MDLRPAWDNVYEQDPDASHFLSWDWLNDLFVRRDEPVCILALRKAQSVTEQSGRYVAFLPLRLRVRLSKSGRHLRSGFAMAGNDWADHTGWLVSKEYETEAIRHFVATLRRMLWSSLEFENLAVNQDRLKLLEDALSSLEVDVKRRRPKDSDGSTRLDVSPFVALPSSVDEWLAQLKPASRKQLQKHRSMLDRSEGQIIEFSTLAMRDSDLDTFSQLWTACWERLKQDRAPRLAQQYTTMIRQGLEAGTLRLLCFRVQGATTAMIACYVDSVRADVLFFVGAQDVASSVVPQDLLLHAAMIEWAINEGYQRYDLLRGDQNYKYALGARDRTLCSLLVSRRASKPYARLLPDAARPLALSVVEHARAKLSTDQVHGLYAQMLDSWPDDEITLTHYRDWLRIVDDHAHADDIEAHLK